MWDLTTIWSIKEFAEQSGREEKSVRDWVIRTRQRLNEPDRVSFARLLQGTGWIVNSQHKLVQKYLNKPNRRDRRAGATNNVASNQVKEDAP